MALIVGRSPLYPVVMLAACIIGFVTGGLAAHVLGGDRGFAPFHGVYGLTIGGLIAGALLEFGTPFLTIIQVLSGGGSGGNGKPPATTPGRWVDPRRLNLAGHLLRVLVMLAALIGWVSLLWVATAPVAARLDVPVALAALLLAIPATTSLVLLTLGAGTLARHLDLTVE